jgi:alcohol dehydrogenase class IV
MEHLEVVGQGLPLRVDPLPFIALPTTAGTGAEVTKNAVIGLPDLGRKVSLRDDRMVARLAIVDPALTDGCPKGVTLASGLDAVTQVIEPFVSVKATPYTDALTRPAIGAGMQGLMRLMQDAQARDRMAWVSLCGGLALANAGLGAVHGLAGVIGGLTGAAHGAICGALLGPVLAANRMAASGAARDRLDTVCTLLAEVLGSTADEAPVALQAWARAQGLPGLAALGVGEQQHAGIATAALQASSMKGNPVVLSAQILREVMERA